MLLILFYYRSHFGSRQNQFYGFKNGQLRVHQRPVARSRDGHPARGLASDARWRPKALHVPLLWCGHLRATASPDRDLRAQARRAADREPLVVVWELDLQLGQRVHAPAPAAHCCLPHLARCIRPWHPARCWPVRRLPVYRNWQCHGGHCGVVLRAAGRRSPRTGPALLVGAASRGPDLLVYALMQCGVQHSNSLGPFSSRSQKQIWVLN